MDLQTTTTPAASHDIQDTVEQVEIKAIRQGFHVVSANAGTGKTHTLAELIALLYVEEEKKLFPLLAPGEHVRGKDQEKILKQIMAITFTRDAAKELDDRVYLLLSGLGIPEHLNPWGMRYRICRTIDSYVHSWMRRAQVIQKLVLVDPDIAGSIEEKLGKLSLETKEALRLAAKGDALIGFFRAWPWLRGDKVSDLIFDVLHRKPDDAIPGLNPETWQAEYDTYLASLPPPPVQEPMGARDSIAWGASFWDSKIEAWTAYQNELRALNERFQRGDLAGTPEYQDSVLKLKVWEKEMAAKKEFFSVLEIARSRGYHPVRSPERLAAIPVLQELSASDQWDDFIDFHNFALQFYAQKLRFGVMDHADFLTACVDTFENHPAMLERDREYPRFGIRAKYVLYDEVQDNSVSNNRLFRVLCAKRDVPYLGVAVGDAKQAIYGFRGACSFGFGAMIDSVKRVNPQNIHHLTCSFRSLARIVELGNECVLTLPSYKATVHPSHTVFTEPGEIIIAPPLEDAEEETNWVLQRVRDILFTTNETVMVLHRNNLHDHPIVDHVKAFSAEYPDRFKHYTIHRSKGLQAHHVFLMGMTATLMPDVRTSYTQMVNLLYVALTRPRKALYITAPYTIERTDDDGMLEIRDVGPTPFFIRLPILKNLAEMAGWPLSMLNHGDQTTKSAAGMLAQRVAGKDAMLRRQWRDLWPNIPVREADGDEPTDETGSAPPTRQIMFITRRSLYEGGRLVLDSGPKLDEGILQRVEVKLRQSWLKNGDVPKFTKEEFITAMKAGWVEKRERGPALVTNKFIALLNPLAGLPSETAP